MLMLSIFPSQEGPQQLCTHAQKTHRNTVDGKSMSHRAYSFIAFQRGAQTVDRLHNQYVSRLHESRKNFGYHWYHLPFWFMPGVARTHWDNSDSCHQLPSHLGWTRWLKAQCIWYYLMHRTCWNNKVCPVNPLLGVSLIETWEHPGVLHCVHLSGLGCSLFHLLIDVNRGTA
jgi:hypothetical protein